MAMRIVLMGVSGCGKSAVGTALASLLGGRFVDGDDLHTEAAKAKMNAGTPLTDEDRWPWLDRVGAAIVTSGEAPIVVACSALKRRYRERILAAAPGMVFVHLDGTRELLAERIGGRSGHFFPAHMLDSQLAALEPLASDEPGFAIGIEKSPAEVAEDIFKAL